MRLLEEIFKKNKKLNSYLHSLLNLIHSGVFPATALFRLVFPIAYGG